MSGYVQIATALGFGEKKRRRAAEQKQEKKMEAAQKKAREDRLSEAQRAALAQQSKARASSNVLAGALGGEPLVGRKRLSV